jgi:hypothetical protein
MPSDFQPARQTYRLISSYWRGDQDWRRFATYAEAVAARARLQPHNPDVHYAIVPIDPP